MNGATPRYDFRRLVATGGMGKVWAAHDTVLDREVAVKVLKDEYADDAHFRARFAAEARHAARLQHPNVAAVLDYGELTVSDEHPQPRPYLVMELVNGQPLSALLAEGRPMPAETAADIVGQAAAGIAAAHAAGVVHRDVKPGNLLVTPDRTVKVTDFGIARATGGVPLTATGHIMGTPHYLSPEQAEGKTVTPASDVYGLGIVLFECLAGRKPFAGESAVATALAHVNDPLPPLPDDVPSWLRGVVRRATDKDPSQRYPDAGALAQAIKDRAPGQAAAATSVLASSTRVMPSGGPATDPAPTPTATHEREDRRRRVSPMLWLGLAAALIAGLLVWALVSGQDEPTADQVDVDPGDYIGRPYAEAAADLSDLGLQPVRADRENPGGETAGAVADVNPTGTVDEGSSVTLEVWGAEPEPTPEPTPTPTPTPTTEPTQTPTETTTPPSVEPSPTIAPSDGGQGGGQGGGNGAGGNSGAGGKG